MKLYTGTGDEGFSTLPGPNGGKIRKDDPRLAALGAIDELNCAIGLCLIEAGRAGRQAVPEALGVVQQELFSLGAMLAASASGAQAAVSLDPAAVARMEGQIDRICEQLPELRHFILPGGCELAGRLHVARTASRQAERALVAAVNPASAAQQNLALRYLNRLSDLLFALARLANHEAGEPEALWKP